MLTAQRMGAICAAIDDLAAAGANTWASIGFSPADLGPDGLPPDWSAEREQMTPNQRAEIAARVAGLDAEWAVPLKA